jgi:hypothetical protein
VPREDHDDEATPELVVRPPQKRREHLYVALTRAREWRGNALIALLLSFGLLPLGAPAFAAGRALLGLALEALGFALFIGWILYIINGVPPRLLRLDKEYVRAVDDPDGRADLRTAQVAVSRIEDDWPTVAPMLGPPGTTLDEALWSLAGDLRRRAELQRARQSLTRVRDDLSANDPALTARVDELTTRYTAVNSAVEAALRRLKRLADECERLRAVVTAPSRVAEVVRQADTVLNGARAAEIADLPRPDPTGELSERTEAVLAAYRELRATA